MSNTITAFFKGRVGVAEAVYQNDYGIVMNLDNIELPAHFDCYFSTLGDDEAIPGIGADNQVVVPNGCLSRSGSVTLHIPLHTGANDSEVEYIVYFKVIGRARPVDDGTPVQMTAIEQALALLQNPITNIEQIVNEALSFTGDTFAEMQAALNADQAAFQDDMGDRADTFEAEIRGDIADVEHDFDILDGQFQTAVAALTVDSEVQGIRTGDDGATYTSAGAAVRTQFANVKNEFIPRIQSLDGEYYINYGDFDIGNLNISNSGWNYNNWATRVRTREGVTIPLKAGDVIHFEDYSTLRYYTGWRDGDGGYHIREWRQSDLIAPEDGEYVFLIANVPESAPTSVVPLASRMSIVSPSSIKADVVSLEREVDANEVRSKAVRDGVVYTTAGNHDLYMHAGETVYIEVTALSSRTNAYISTNSDYSIPINSVGTYQFTARDDGYFSNYSFGASDFSMNMKVHFRTRYDDEIDAIEADVDIASHYTVDVNGSGDYTSFTACIEALESDSSKKVITILEGDYDIYTEIGGSAYVDSLTGTDWRSVNAIVPPNTIIKGVGDVNLLYLPDTAAEVGKTLISPLNLSGNVEVHNINIHCQNCRYAIHLEGSALAEFDDANILLDNVNIVRDKALYARQVLGSGLNKGCTLVVKNCTWENTDSQNFYVHTNSLVKHPRIIVENCQFITHGTSSFYFSSENKVHSGEVLVRLNNVYANNSNITKADIQNGDCFHVIANGCNALTQSTFNTGYTMNDLDQYLTIS